MTSVDTDLKSGRRLETGRIKVRVRVKVRVMIKVRVRIKVRIKIKDMVNPLLSYPHGNKMKGYGSCALFITISDFRDPPK
jgi:hypothetical protein